MRIQSYLFPLIDLPRKRPYSMLASDESSPVKHQMSIPTDFYEDPLDLSFLQNFDVGEMGGIIF